MIAAFSRHAQYSAIAPSLSKQCGSQYPRYSLKLFVSSLVRGVERRLAGENGRGVGRDAVRDRDRERVVGRVHPHVDGCDLPAVRRVDVVRTCRRGADEIGHRSQ